MIRLVESIGRTKSQLVKIPITACIDRELLWLLARSLFVQGPRGARPRTLAVWGRWEGWGGAHGEVTWFFTSMAYS